MSKGSGINMKSTSFTAHVQLGLAPGDEKHILSGLRYLKHSWSKQIHFKSPLCWQRAFTRLKVPSKQFRCDSAPALSLFLVYSINSLQWSEHNCNIYAAHGGCSEPFSTI